MTLHFREEKLSNFSKNCIKISILIRYYKVIINVIHNNSLYLNYFVLFQFYSFNLIILLYYSNLCMIKIIIYLTLSLYICYKKDNKGNYIK